MVRVDHGCVVGQLSRRFWYSCAFKISGRAQHYVAGRGKFARSQRRVAKRPDAEREVYAFLKKVNRAIIQDKIEGKIGMRSQKGGQSRHNVLACKGDGCTHAQPTAKGHACLACYQICLVGTRYRSARVLVKALSCFRRHEAAR
jgi:hypothetical protein